jgi:hypothetical protein
MGKRMNITDIPRTIEALDAFNVEYEKSRMIYSPANNAVARPTLDLFASLAPSCLYGFMVSVLTSLFDERLANALGYEMQPIWFVGTINTLLHIHAFVVYNLFLPRPRFLIFSARRTAPSCVVTN